MLRKTGLVQELKKTELCQIENIEELLNGIVKDFTEGQKEIDGARGFCRILEDVALVTDLDKDTGDDDRVAPMTIHPAKGIRISTCVYCGIMKKICFQALTMSLNQEAN